MKICKRVIAVFLCAIMIVGVFPLGAFAENNSNQDVSLQSEGYDLNATNGMGRALMKTAAQGDAEGETPGYSFSYCYVDNKTAYVGLNNANKCTLVVSIYSEETGQMLGSGVKTIEANTFDTEVSIDIGTMPKYFVAKAFLLDEDMASLCKPFTVIDYSKQYEEFDKKTVDDFAGSVIVNFDEQKDDNFAVLLDGAIDDSNNKGKNILISYDETSGKYVFDNIDDAIKNLKPGDIFYKDYGDDICLINVKSISINGNKATIYENLDAEYSDYFKYIDVDISSGDSADQMSVNMDDAEEGIECLGISEFDDSVLQTQGGWIDVNNSISFGPEWSTDKYIVGSESSTVKVKVAFKLKAGVTFNFRIFYDPDWEWRLDFWNSYTDDFYFQMKIDIKLTGSVTLSGAVEHDFKLGEIDFVTPAGVVVTTKAKLHVEVSASVSLSIDFIKVTIGFRYDDDTGFQNLCSGPDFSLIPKLDVKAEVKIGLKLDPEVSFIKIVGISLSPQFGYKMELKADTIDFAKVFNVSDVDYIHTCGQSNCFNGEIDKYLTLKGEGKILGKNIKTKVIAEYTSKVWDCHLKLSPFEFSLFNKCPNYCYRCDFTVVNKNDKPIENLQIVSNAPDLSGYYDYNTTNATDSTGQVSFFYPQGKNTPEFYLNGKEISADKIRISLFKKEINSATITISDSTLKIKYKIDTTATEGGGNGHNGGTGGSDLHMRTATFKANGGKFSDGSTTVSLNIKQGDPITPPAEPTRDGYYFAGWSPEIPDKMPSSDATYTAQWSTTPVTGYSDGTGSNDGIESATIIRFGSYPQSEVTDSSTISALNSKASGWKSYNYYSGTGSNFNGQMTSSDYMRYCDVKYGGNKYRGVTFDSYRPSFTGLTSSSSNQDVNGYSTGTTYWFKYEPLKWRILDASTGLVMCETIIDSQPYNNYILNSGTDDSYGYSAYWGDSAQTYYSSDYENSSIRKWLREDFYATAFSQSQQSKIKTTTLNNDGYYTLTGRTGYEDYDSNSTNDKIFLLSYDEVLNSSFGFSTSTGPDSTRQAKDSDYAKCQGLYNSSDGNYDGCSYWRLRSPGIRSDGSCYVNNGGSVGYNYVTYFTGGGVRPALKLNLSSLSTQSDIGTQAVEGTGVFKYSCSACEAGGEYILLNVSGYGDNFTLSSSNLEYIDQITADASGKVSGRFTPRKAASDSTTLLIGRFGGIIRVEKLSVTEAPADIPDTPDNPDTPDAEYSAKPKLYTGNSTTITVWSNVTIVAKADNVPKGYKLVVCDKNNKVLKEGDNKSVSYNAGAISSDTVFNIHVVDGKGNIMSSDGEELSKTIEVKTSGGFFVWFLGFLFNLFGIDPGGTVIEP